MRKRFVFAVRNLASLLLVPAFAGTMAAQAPAHPLGIEDAIRAKSFPVQGDIGSLSPDGRWVVYTLEAKRPGDVQSKGQDFLPSGAPSTTNGSIHLMDISIGTTILIGDSVDASGRAVTSWAPAWSPDGRCVAFYSDQDGTAGLWVWELATHKLRRISKEIVHVLFPFETPRWTPDSRSIITKILPEGTSLADANRVVIPASASTKAKTYPGATVTVYRAAADTTLTPGAPAPSAGKPEPTAPDTTVDTSILKSLSREHGDLAIFDIKTGAVRRLAPDSYITGWTISSDGASVLYFDIAGMRRNTQQMVSDLFSVSLQDDRQRVLVPHVPQDFGRGASWSPDGRTVAYVTDGQLAKGDVYVVPASGGTPQPLTTTKHPKFAWGDNWPIWLPHSDALLVVGNGRLWKVTLDGQTTPVTDSTWREVTQIVSAADGHTAWSSDGGRSVFVFTREPATKRVGIYRVDLGSGATTRVREEDANYGTGWSAPVVSRNGNRVAYLSEAAQRDRNLWIADAGFANARQLTHINPAFDAVTFGASRLVSYWSDDGELLHGALLLPGNYQPGKRYPLIVRVYPGPSTHSDKLNRFGLEGAGAFSNMQLLATRGYAVLYPEAPQHLGTPMRDIARTVLPAINAVVGMGIADPERIGVFGHSYGGYTTLALITESTWFRAAVMSDGPGDLVSMYGAMRPDGAAFGIGWSETGQGLMGGTPWQYPDRYVENSPITHLDRVRTPLLIVHGADDEAVPSWQSDAVFVGLRRLGREVEYRKYAGEGHVISSFENLADLWTSIIGWFDTHLKS